MKNVFLKENNCRFDPAKKVFNLIVSKDFDYVSVRPRNSPEILVMVACTEIIKK